MGSKGSKWVVMGITAAVAVGFGTVARAAAQPTPAVAPEPPMMCFDCGMLPAPPPILLPAPPALPIEPICLDCGMLPSPPALPLHPPAICSDCGSGSIPTGPFHLPKKPKKPLPPIAWAWPHVFTYFPICNDCKTGSIPAHPPIAFSGPEAGLNVTRFEVTRPVAEPAVKTARDAGPSNAGFHH